VKFEISGPGKIIAVDNGDATSFESFQASERNAFNGLALVIVQSAKEAGRIVLKATSPDLQSAETVIQTGVPKTK
jgi:beta-galactosidase